MSQPSYEQFKPGYQALWDTMVINPRTLPRVNEIVKNIKANKPRYDEVNAAVQKVAIASRIPWYFIGLVHKMECDLSFRHHLHNGDPLTARTVQVPPGRPKTGHPPFTFVESAVDALLYQGLTAEIDWSVTKMLFRLEGYNGYGYRPHGVNTPYLWAGSNHYTSGKFIADHMYSSKAVSDQIGTAVILKMLL